MALSAVPENFVNCLTLILQEAQVIDQLIWFLEAGTVNYGRSILRKRY